jgi:hypothetical protein
MEVLNLRPRPLYPREGILVVIEYEVGRGPETIWTFLEEKNLLPLPEFEPRTIHHAAQSLYRHISLIG